MNPTAEALLALFDECADVQARELAPIAGPDRRKRTDKPGQYALDLVADDAIVPLLLNAGVAVVSEESGLSGDPDADITVVLDPVDGSTNCSRGIPYWAISLCAVDADGMLCALVGNQATGERFTAVRGEGAWCDGRPVGPSSTTTVAGSFVAITGMPDRTLPWKQFRALGSAALTLCDVADGRVDIYLDTTNDMHAAWDYLGGLLVCREAGAVVEDVRGRELVSADGDTRRTLLGAATPELLADLRTLLAS